MPIFKKEMLVCCGLDHTTGVLFQQQASVFLFEDQQVVN
jgi:hypothetical protein